MVLEIALLTAFFNNSLKWILKLASGPHHAVISGLEASEVSFALLYRTNKVIVSSADYGGACPMGRSAWRKELTFAS
jgi:hypothetical protein